MEIVERIRHILQGVNPAYHFRYENVDYMNLKADDISRNERFVFMEAIRSGRFRQINRRLCKMYRVDLYFCAFVDLDLDSYDDAETGAYKAKADVLAEIEAEIATPMVKALATGHSAFVVGDIDFGYPNTSRFDGNEVSVRVGFMYALPIC